MGDFIIGSRTQDPHTHTPVSVCTCKSGVSRKKTAANDVKYPRPADLFWILPSSKSGFSLFSWDFSPFLRIYSDAHFRKMDQWAFFFYRQTIFPILNQIQRGTLSSPGNMREKESRSQESGASPRKNRLSSLVARTHIFGCCWLMNTTNLITYSSQDPPAPAVAASEFYSQTTLHAHKKNNRKIFNSNAKWKSCCCCCFFSKLFSFSSSGGQTGRPLRGH